MNDRKKRILDHYTRVKSEDYTTLIVVGSGLYERYYPTYDHPDYTLVEKELTEQELDFCANLGIGKR